MANPAALPMGLAIGAAVAAVGYYIADFFLDELNVSGGMWTVVLFLIPATLALIAVGAIMTIFR